MLKEKNLFIFYEDDEKLIFGIKDKTVEKCPSCNEKRILIHDYWIYKISIKGSKEFIKKDIYIRRKRYRCYECNKRFQEIERDLVKFKKGIQDDKFKPFLKILLKNKQIEYKSITDMQLKQNYDDIWRVLKESEKIITLIHINTAEIKEFLIKNKTISKKFFEEIKIK